MRDVSDKVPPGAAEPLQLGHVFHDDCRAAEAFQRRRPDSEHAIRGRRLANHGAVAGQGVGQRLVQFVITHEGDKRLAHGRLSSVEQFSRRRVRPDYLPVFVEEDERVRGRLSERVEKPVTPLDPRFQRFADGDRFGAPGKGRQCLRPALAQLRAERDRNAGQNHDEGKQDDFEARHGRLTFEAVTDAAHSSDALKAARDSLRSSPAATERERRPCGCRRRSRIPRRASAAGRARAPRPGGASTRPAG